MRVVFCGSGPIGLPALRALADSPHHELVGVVCQPDRPAGRTMQPRISVIKSEALTRGVPIFQPERIRTKESISALVALKPDVMIVAAYGQMLSRDVLTIPPFGCLNLHASLLPRHRGASPIQAAIAAGDLETGITVMYMDEGLDTGDILLMDKISIGSEETAGELHDRLAILAAGSMLRSLELLLKGTAPRVRQEDRLATYAPKLRKTDGWLDWTLPASVLARIVRAMSPWPGAFARLTGSKAFLKIHKASRVRESGVPGHILSAGPEGILVAAGEDSLLLQEIQREGRKRLSAVEFLRGMEDLRGRMFDLSFSVGPG